MKLMAALARPHVVMRLVLAVALSAVLATACTALPPAASPPATPPPMPVAPPSTPVEAPRTPAAPIATASRPPEALEDLVQEIRSEMDRAPAGAVPDTAISQLVAADAAFGLALYRHAVAGESGNAFLSPYSISTALSMTYAGARGQTAAELERALNVAQVDADWHACRNELELRLLSERPVPEGLTPLTLEPTNAIFGQAGFPFEASYVDTLASHYGAGLQTVDFISNAEGARQAVNEWISERTRERISELLPPDSVSQLTRFVLVNAIYFKGNWLRQFEPDLTRDRPFTLLDGHEVSVPMMHSVDRSSYGAGDGWQAVQLPYAGQASMLVIVPDEGQFAEVEERLDTELVGRVRAALDDVLLTLDLPRWESSSEIDLQDLLTSMGVTTLFEPTVADLSGIAPPEDLHVSAALHQANISVDEQGTEAAAATAVVGSITSGPPRSVTLSVDRPFIYLVQDDVTGEILFVGRLLDPTAD